MRRYLAIITCGILILTLLAGCAAAATATRAAQGGAPGGAGGQFGGRQRGSGTPGAGFNGTPPAGFSGTPGAGGGQFGGRTGNATATETLAPTATATVVPTATQAPTSTATPTITLTPRPTLVYDARFIIQNNSPYTVKYSLIGPTDREQQVTLYLEIPKGETGFLQAPHGRYAITTTLDTVSMGSYTLPAGGWSCQIWPDGCKAFIK